MSEPQRRIIECSRHDWLPQAAQLALTHQVKMWGDLLVIHDRQDLTAEMAQAALDAQYGPGVFQAWVHGRIMRVRRRHPETAPS